ncbi:MAG: hypothetical protein ACE5E9_02375 [Nitrospinaceae bacterium]
MTTEQIGGLVLFFLGTWILSLCAKWERRDEDWIKDPKNRYKSVKESITFPNLIRGRIMTYSGGLLALIGFVMFFTHLKVN